MEHQGVGELQLPQPVPAADQDAGAGEVGAQQGVEGGGAVARRLGGSGQDRFCRLRGVVRDEEGGGGSHDAAGAGVGRVRLGGRDPQGRADVRGTRNAGAALQADVVVQGLEGRGPGGRLGELAGAQQSVQDEGHRGL